MSPRIRETAAVVVTVREENGPTYRESAYEMSVQFIEELTSKCDKAQTKVLAEILCQNRETEYLKRYGMSLGHLDRETFKTNVPVVTYDDIKPDIMRVYNGDFSPILCAQPIVELLFRRIEGKEPDKGKMLGLLLTRDETITPGGLIARPGLNTIFKNPQFYKDNPYPYNTNTSPIEAIHCPDHYQSLYTQLLCGFYQRHDVTLIKVVFGSNLIWAIQFLKTHYSNLCSDISSGNLNPKITDTSLRACIIETFMQHPQPKLSKFIESICVEDNWEGILPKIWPNAKYIEAIITGSMTQYIPMLNYYSGGLALVSLNYSSSECDLGYNLDPMCDPYDISYTIMPNMAYYEFLPLNDNFGTQIEPIDMAHVVVGQEYEVVVTTFSGLFRYRMGDVLSPTRFYNSTPQFKFVRRRNVVLNLNIERTTESELHKAIEMASKMLQPYGTTILDYTSSSCTNIYPGYYIIYLELITKTLANRPGPKILEECCLMMEETLGYYYRASRNGNSIGPLEIRVLSNGTFEKLMDHAISNGATFNQFKMPRCVKLASMLELLDSRVVSTHFSPSMPHCRP